MATQPGTSDCLGNVTNKYVRYGSSPRGAQALIECGRVLAVMRGRTHLSIDDITAVAAERAAAPHYPQFRRACGWRGPQSTILDEDSEGYETRLTL